MQGMVFSRLGADKFLFKRHWRAGLVPRRLTTGSGRWTLAVPGFELGGGSPGRFWPGGRIRTAQRRSSFQKGS